MTVGDEILWENMFITWTWKCNSIRKGIWLSFDKKTTPIAIEFEYFGLVVQETISTIKAIF